MLKIELTADQKAQLETYFETVLRSNKSGGVAAIVAQVWPDAFVAKILIGNQAVALAETLNGNPNRRHCSADDRMESES